MKRHHLPKTIQEIIIIYLIVIQVTPTQIAPILIKHVPITIVTIAIKIRLVKILKIRKKLSFQNSRTKMLTEESNSYYLAKSIFLNHFKIRF